MSGYRATMMMEWSKSYRRSSWSIKRHTLFTLIFSCRAETTCGHHWQQVTQSSCLYQWKVSSAQRQWQSALCRVRPIIVDRQTSHQLRPTASRLRLQHYHSHQRSRCPCLCWVACLQRPRSCCASSIVGVGAGWPSGIVWPSGTARGSRRSSVTGDVGERWRRGLDVGHTSWMLHLSAALRYICAVAETGKQLVANITFLNAPLSDEILNKYAYALCR